MLAPGLDSLRLTPPRPGRVHLGGWLSTFDWSAQSGTWKAVLVAKLFVVAAAGFGAGLHARATSKAAVAVWGSVAGLASVAALAMGILLAG